MQRFRLPRQFAGLALVVGMVGGVVGEAALADQQTNTVATFSSPLSYQMYNILAAEMYIRQGNPGQAALHYIAAAQQAESAKFAQRASELATSANDNQLASRALELWTKLDPNSEDAREYRTLSHVRAGRYDEAVKDLALVRDYVEKKEGHGFEFIASLLEMEPAADGKAYETFKRYVASADNSTRAQLVLASLAINAQRFDDGLKAAQAVKATGDRLQKVQAARLASRAYMGLQQVDKAIDELAPVVKTSKDVDLKLDYGRMLILTDRRAEATPLYKQLYASQPENSDVVYTLGLLYLEQKKFEFAEPLIKKLLKVPERAADASYFMGQIYEGQKHPKEAIEAYKRATTSSFMVESTGRAARLLMETDSLDAARQWLDEQLKAANNDASKAHILLVEGKLLHERERYKEAVGVFDKLLVLKPDDVDARYNRSLSNERLGSFAAAEADLRALIKLQPENATVLNALGYMLVVNTNRYPEAEELIRKALAIRPTDPAIMDSMGWILFHTGKQDEAEGLLRKAYAQLHEPEIASHLVEVLSARNKAAEAKAILQDILSKFPNDQTLIKLKEKLVGL
jgi:tetratricopeptide (TPR) repeat protein